MDKRPAAPKFASFKPKAEAPSHPPALSAERGLSEGGRDRHVPNFASTKRKSEESSTSSAPGPRREPSRERGKENRERRDHHRKRSRHTRSPSHHDRHERQRSRSGERLPRSASTQIEPMYTIDKRGDPLIARYGSNERSRVPNYRRYGSGRVMGAPGRLRFVYDGPRELFSLGNKFGEGPSAFRDRILLSKASRKKSRLFRLRSVPAQESTPPDEDWYDFIPLSGSRKRERTSDDPDDVSKEDQPDYRSIQGKAKDRDFVDSDLESAASSDSEAETGKDHLDPIKQRSIELSRQVKEHPEDVDAWLDLVDVQESLLRLDEHTRQERTSNEVKALASIRVSLLEEALTSIQDVESRERLQLRLMREGSRVWSSKKLASLWSEISLTHSSFALWKAHVDHELSNVTGFKYDEMKRILLERLLLLKRRLSDIAGDSVRSDNANSVAGVCDELIYVFSRITRFIHDSGYSELAIAAWQAVLELNFARPREDSYTDSDDLLSSLSDFWESEIPRIGEDGAKGWRHFSETEQMDDLPDAKMEAALITPKTKDVYKAWAAVERHRGSNAELPARTLDEGTEDDPFRVVMFSDLKDLLFYIPSSLLESTGRSLLDAFLLFCRMPPASKDPSDMVQKAYNDPLLHGKSTSWEAVGPSERPNTDSAAAKPPRFSRPSGGLAMSADVLFAGADWFNYHDQDTTPVSDLALRTTTQLALHFDFEPVAEYSLALAWRKNPTGVKKAAKALLKRYPSSTRLYNAYALAEWRNDKRDVTQTIFSSATYQDLPNKQLLWNTWSWLELEAGDTMKALARCICSVEETGSAEQSGGLDPILTPSQTLKARQKLLSARDFLISSGDLPRAAEIAQTLALFDYISAEGSTEPRSTHQGNISAAMASIHTFKSDAVARGHGKSTSLERLLQFSAHLLYLYATRGPFRPPFLRDQVKSFILLFPTNTIFLNLFAWADTSLLINDPVRETLRTLVLKDPYDCVSNRIFAILHEMDVGTVHSARTAFDQALDSDACRGNTGLWLSYIRFCQQHRRELKGKAKDVYYMAIRNCSWSKELAMEAFTTLVRDMESSELRAVLNTMTAKGLRIRVDFDEFSAQRGHNT
ncbi:hypothetical protein VPNG_00537 [Cytospora leucostoma]|uniref:DUF1740-domain-containing protein n=1 Tax=Cytospora leucostoma TaxID=1230097 RepID=A0A423XMG4_9PEZI|nr:hypothetical protein VPNG_00537 [Cytospora leucostoma]